MIWMSWLKNTIMAILKELNKNSMEAKLIKTKEGLYHLKFNNDHVMLNCGLGLLSLKNCEAIANGYDLDELAEKHYGVHIKHGHTEEDSLQRKIDFTIGFVSALEILGDKKFSEKDLRTAYGVGYLMKINPSDEYHETLNGLVQLLQQTEWDVEIEMICPHPMDTYRCGLQYGCDGDGCNHPEQVPYLDSDGCLILRKI